MHAGFVPCFGFRSSRAVVKGSFNWPWREHKMSNFTLAQNVVLEGQMATNPAPSLGIEFSHIDDAQRLGTAPSIGAAQHANTAQVFSQRLPRRQLPALLPANSDEATTPAEPFASLFARHGRPLKIAILSDFTRIAYANGAAFQTRFLYQELRKCGHEVTLIGPHDPDATPEEIPPGTISLPSVPVRMYPGLHVPLPLAGWVYDATRWDFDLVFAQTTSLLMEFGVWLRKMRGIPLLCVNTTHLVAAYDVLLPEALSKHELVHASILGALRRPYEKLYSRIYNDSDGLVVLSEGLRSYWRECGVTAPIHVIPRAVQPEVFDRPLGEDPYLDFIAPQFADGQRLLCAGRHTREKAQDRLIRIFARHVAPFAPHATLTLLGVGPDTEFYKHVAADEGVADRVYFPGETPFSKMADFYAYADVFAHTSLSETYGNVLGEALWCGTPTVAFADGMGASSQVRDGVSGVLLSPGASREDQAQADASFGRGIRQLLADPELRAKLSAGASRAARKRATPHAVLGRLASAFEQAQDHAQCALLRPRVDGPKALQLWTTFQHFRTWAAFNGGVAALGTLRRAHGRSEATHPQMHTDAKPRPRS
jgi:1,2-diacylglycerol 3-alpha-glucosyltransferase